ncbi:glutathione peroxidase [Euzebya pacifica]|uniref:glutathione peroxidase n=1 Tax=Euzebya pacifica TaxID=1608957 RepID=UPI000DF77C1D|nr:glutathione peroxidase [Euzebya pacifica]
MNVYDIAIPGLEGTPAAVLDQQRGRATLIVNVASRCGLTPQYEGLVELADRYGDRGFGVVGVPCNQFMGQEPGSAGEIREFCSTTYGVDFPLTAKVDVNGDDRHPLYEALASTPDADGHDGDIRWNFEKFLVGPDGVVVQRFGPKVEPLDNTVTSAIEASLPAQQG